MSDEKYKLLQGNLSSIKIDTSLLRNVGNIRSEIPNSYYDNGNQDVLHLIQNAQVEKQRKEELHELREIRILELMEAMHDNVLSIKNNSDNLVFNTEELIETIIVSNKISEANLLIIEQTLEKILENESTNIFEEIKKVAVGMAAQKGLATGYVFLLKLLPYLQSMITPK